MPGAAAKKKALRQPNFSATYPPPANPTAIPKVLPAPHIDMVLPRCSVGKQAERSEVPAAEYHTSPMPPAARRPDSCGKPRAKPAERLGRRPLDRATAAAG